MPPRRTTTIQQVIRESKPIIQENLAPTRSKKVKIESSDSDFNTKSKPTKKQTSQSKNKKKEQEQPKSPVNKGSPELPSRKARTKSEKIQDKINSKTNKKQNNKQQNDKHQENEEEKQNEVLKQNNSELEQKILSTPEPVIPKKPKEIVDIVFCCDTTASMGSYLEQTKQVVSQIIAKLKEKADESVSVQFGFVCYRDHPPQEVSYLTKVKDLCDENEIQAFIEQQTAKGGGDAPEAVLDGLYEAATNIKWREEENGKYFRYVFHIADQPPHGKEFGVQSEFEDGVPTGVTLDKVAKEINSRNIRYKLIKANRTYTLERMIKLFKENFTSYEETNLSDATQINNSITEIILKDLN